MSSRLLTSRQPAGVKYLDVKTSPAEGPIVRTSPVWDPQQYNKYADERGRPFADLVGRIRADEPATVVDLGCGPGNLTVTLLDRWPTASVQGIDSSPQM